MNASTRDLIIAVAACALIIFFFASIELIELFFDFTRKYEEWNLDEVIAAVPALALVTAWFAGRRWREIRRLNGELEETVAQLEEAIAQRRAMEEQLGEAYKMAAMGALTGGLAHEFNNVLQPIVTLAQLTLDRGDLPEEQRTRIRHILKAAEHGCDVVKGTLAFPAGGTQETHDMLPAEDLAAFVQKARGNLGEVEIDTRIAADPVAVRVNRTEFHQVLTNLVKNAAEAMDHRGRIEIGVGSRTLDAEGARAKGLAAGRYVRVTVADNGPGMAPEVRDQIFDPFFTTKEAGEGTGLGLAIVYSLVQGWDGKISVYSSPGNGAAFEILIPRLETGA